MASDREIELFQTALSRIDDEELEEYDDLDEDQLAIGTAVEMEHTSYEEDALRIAAVHLDEDPKYYVKLEVLEASAENDA